jgi:hypothetical protein
MSASCLDLVINWANDVSSTISLPNNAQNGKWSATWSQPQQPLPIRVGAPAPSASAPPNQTKPRDFSLTKKQIREFSTGWKRKSRYKFRKLRPPVVFSLWTPQLPPSLSLSPSSAWIAAGLRSLLDRVLQLEQVSSLPPHPLSFWIGKILPFSRKDRPPPPSGDLFRRADAAGAEEEEGRASRSVLLKPSCRGSTVRSGAAAPGAGSVSSWNRLVL